MPKISSTGEATGGAHPFPDAGGPQAVPEPGTADAAAAVTGDGGAAAVPEPPPKAAKAAPPPEQADGG